MARSRRTARWIVLAAAFGSWFTIPARQAAAQVPIWVKLPPPAIIDLHVRDTRRDREIFFDEKGLVAVPDAASISWQSIFTGVNPAVFQYHVAFYDSTRDRIWAMSSLLSDTLKLWYMNLSAEPLAWTLQPTVYTLADTTIQSSSLGFDPTHDRVLAFGGFLACPGCLGGAINRVYALSLSGTPEWSRAVVGDASAPSPRAGCGMGYDPWRDRMLIYGGDSFGPTYYDETWALSLDPPMTWTFLVPTVLPPSGRVPSVNLVDSQGQRWMISGDGSQWPNGHAETWALDLSPSVAADQATWTRIPPDQNDPQPLTRRGLWAQPAQSRIVSYDGADLPYHEADLWTLAQGSADWNLVGGGTLGLVERAGLITFVDPDIQRVYAGLGPDSTLQYRPLDQDVPWVRLTPTPGPGTRADAVAVTDLAARRALVFGGADYFNIYFEGQEFADLWAFDLDTRAWTLLDAAGPMIARTAALGVFDAASRKLIVHGGRYKNPGPIPLGDTWIYDAVGGTWSAAAAGSYGSRWGEVGIYDPVRRQVVAFGGTGDGSSTFTDVHVLPLSPTVGTWSALTTTGGPLGWGTEVTVQRATYDPDGDRMIVTTGPGPDTEVWALALGPTPTWTELAPVGTSPARRFGAALVSDPARQRSLLIGGSPGEGGPGTIGDTWALYYDKATPTQLALMSVDAVPDQVTLRWYAGGTGSVSANVYRRATGEAWRALGQSFVDGTGVFTWIDRDVVAGAAYDYRLGVARADGERFYGETHVVVPDRSIMSLEGVQPNPSDGPMLVAFSLAGVGAASLDLLDVTGRWLMGREVGSLGAGRHFVRLDEAAERLGAGLYFLRLTQGRNVRTAKIVIVR